MNNTLDLTKIKWREFNIGKIFNEIIKNGKRLKLNDQIKGNIPYISATAINNGIDNFISNNTIAYKNCLTIANNGGAGDVFFHKYKFIASDNVTILKRKNANKYNYLFIAPLLSRISKNNSYTMRLNSTKIKNQKILLPINNSGDPDWIFMENFMKYQEYKLIKKYLNFLENNKN